MLYFPEYICIATLDRERKYTGQLMLYHKSLRRPSMSFSYGAKPAVHHPEGRVLIAEFPHLKIVSVYVPCSSDLSAARLERRRKFDKQTMNYLALCAKTSVKPVLFAGDMNAVEDLQYTTHDEEHWQQLVQNKHFHMPTKPEDHQWAGTSDAEIARFSAI